MGRSSRPRRVWTTLREWPKACSPQQGRSQALQADRLGRRPSCSTHLRQPSVLESEPLGPRHAHGQYEGPGRTWTSPQCKAQCGCRGSHAEGVLHWCGEPEGACGEVRGKSVSCFASCSWQALGACRSTRCHQDRHQDLRLRNHLMPMPRSACGCGGEVADTVVRSADAVPMDADAVDAVPLWSMRMRCLFLQDLRKTSRWLTPAQRLCIIEA